MYFKVFNRMSAKKFSSEEHDYSSAFITITDTNKENLNILKTKENNIKAVLPLKFDDVEKTDPILKEYAITAQDAEKIVDFVGHYKNKVKMFGVNCEGGVSRSAGCCAAIMMAIVGDDSAIFDDPSKCPNMKVYRTVLKAFEKDGYFDDDQKGLSVFEIKNKENHNIEIWKKEQQIF